MVRLLTKYISTKLGDEKNNSNAFHPIYNIVCAIRGVTINCTWLPSMPTMHQAPLFIH